MDRSSLERFLVGTFGFYPLRVFGRIQIRLAGKQRDDTHNDKQDSQDQHNCYSKWGHGLLLSQSTYTYTMSCLFWFSSIY